MPGMHANDPGSFSVPEKDEKDKFKAAKGKAQKFKKSKEG